MSVNDYTLDDAHNHGFDLLELYRLWHWNSCFPFAERHDEIDERIDAIKREIGERYVLLPVDADNEYIHIGDELCGYGYPGGGVYCQAIVNESFILVGESSIAYKNWLLWDAADCHHRKPTVEDVLRKYASIIIGVGEGPELESVLSECAGRIKEVMADE